MQNQEVTWDNWTQVITRYTQPDPFKSWWQVINSFVPYILLWVLMVRSLEYSYWITLLLSMPAAGFLVRIFIIFHDCGHGSFLKSKTLNKVVGIIAGALSFTAYHKWHAQHQVHHQTVGDLDKRGMGDVLTITVEEYKNRSRWQRIYYRFYRHPVVLFIIAPFFLFTIAQCVPDKRLPKKITLYTHLTTLGLIIALAMVSWSIGFRTFILIQIPVLFFASVFGVWLFYVQHQFKDTVWVRSDKWDYKMIAMNGSSCLKLPRILQWFSGNIGFHHIHHLSPRIPNYNLEKCYLENPLFQKKPLTLAEALGTWRFGLWDEEKGRLVTFKEAGV
ncbi:MAG: fatty acid desaturase [Bacteroidales bacterium]